MNNSEEECSSGCESGWTLYLEHSFLRPKQIHDEEEQAEEGTDEDLSMVSDASSGPPLYFQDEDGSFDNNHSQEATVSTTSTSSGKRKKTQKNRKPKEQIIPPNQVMRPLGYNSFLDDTASSPALNSTATIPHHHVLDYSQPFSATHFQQRGSGEYDGQFGYVQPSSSGNYLQNNQWF
ncbi:Protein SOB FIVE-LIKE 5 [Linum perenne]